MSETLYCDTGRVAEAFKTLVGAVSHDDYDTSVTLSVHDAPVVMRGITMDEVKERNISRRLDEVCSFKYDGTTMELRFHESQVDGTFELDPAGPTQINADQATDPADLAPSLGPILDVVEEHYDVMTYDFAKVSAASIAQGGHLTSYEFTYELTSLDW